MTGTVKLLRELIAVPSVNPTFFADAPAYTGEQRVADFLASLAGPTGMSVEFRKVRPGRPNLLVRMSPTGKIRQRVLLAPHLDTVGGPELPGKLFTPEIKGDRLYGRGACDTKGSVAVMFTALQELAQSGSRPEHTEIVFAGLIDEECSQKGSRALVGTKFKADLAIVGEPTRLQVVTGHKGVLWLKLKTRGHAAHGSHPELGCNAVHAMARIVDALETGYAAQLRERTHRLLGQATINVGAMHGGNQPNIVPAECIALVDRRTLPGETEPQVFKEIKSFLQAQELPITQGKPSQERPAGSRAPAAFEMRKMLHTNCPALETESEQPLVSLFLKCARQKAGGVVDYFSDAGVLSNGGIPSVLFGPGDIAQAHKPDEWVSIKQIEAGKNLLLRYLRSLS